MVFGFPHEKPQFHLKCFPTLQFSVICKCLLLFFSPSVVIKQKASARLFHFFIFCPLKKKKTLCDSDLSVGFNANLEDPWCGFIRKWKVMFFYVKGQKVLRSSDFGHWPQIFRSSRKHNEYLNIVFIVCIDYILNSGCVNILTLWDFRGGPRFTFLRTNILCIRTCHSPTLTRW